MSLLPDDATFEELVHECYLTYKCCGLAISVGDAQLVRDWASRRVPFEVVARGIRRGAAQALWDARPGEPPLRSLKKCRRQVESEIRKHLTLVAGRGSATEKKSNRRNGARSRFRTALRRAAARWPSLAALVQELLQGEEGWKEEAICLRLVRALPFRERLELIRDARAWTSFDPLASALARRRGRRFVLGALVRKKLSLPTFW